MVHPKGIAEEVKKLIKNSESLTAASLCTIKKIQASQPAEMNSGCVLPMLDCRTRQSQMPAC